MALTITVSLEPARAAAHIDVTGLTGATYTIERQSPSGNTAGVRGHVDAAVAAAEVTARDYEAPLNVDLVYTATDYAANGTTISTATAASFTVDWVLCESWLVDLARPTNSLPLVIQSLDTLTFDLANGVHRVLDRRDPVLTTLPAYTPAGELVLLTDTLEQRDMVRAILGNGYPVLLRTSPDMGIGNLYLGLTAFAEERFLTLGNRPERRFRAQVVQSHAPTPPRTCRCRRTRSRTSTTPTRTSPRSRLRSVRLTSSRTLAARRAAKPD